MFSNRAFQKGCYSKLLLLLSNMPVNRTEQAAFPGGEYSEQKKTNIHLLSLESICASQEVITAIFTTITKKVSVPRRTAANVPPMWLVLRGKRPQNFFLSQLIYHLIYENIKVCQELCMLPTRILGERALFTPAVLYNIIHLDPGILTARNFSNSSSPSCLIMWWRSVTHSNHILGPMRQCAFSNSKQVNKQRALNACPRCLSYYISILTILYQYNSL